MIQGEELARNYVTWLTDAPHPLLRAACGLVTGTHAGTRKCSRPGSLRLRDGSPAGSSSFLQLALGPKGLLPENASLALPFPNGTRKPSCSPAAELCAWLPRFLAVWVRHGTGCTGGTPHAGPLGVCVVERGPPSRGPILPPPHRVPLLFLGRVAYRQDLFSG